MPPLNFAWILGTFALATFILALAAFGRLLGLGLEQALYVSMVIVIGLFNIVFRSAVAKAGRK